MPTSLKRLQEIISMPNAKKQIQQQLKETSGGGFFHEFLEEQESSELYQKIKLLFTKVKAFDLDINQVWLHQFFKGSKFSKWGNTPIHNGLSYENFRVVEFFIAQAHEHQIDINFQAQDVEGKTPLMLAIKVNAPIELISKLVTDENYLMSDRDGMTAMMLACAMRRIDVMKLLIEHDAKVKGYGPIDFTAITAEQKIQMSEFINQVHGSTGKSLGHFSVLRAGTLSDQKGENLPKDDKKQIRLAKMGCVINLLKEAGMDGFRDEHALWNCITNENREPISTQSNLLEDGQLCFVSDHAQRDDSGQVYLNTQDNLNSIFRTFGSVLKVQYPNFYQHLQSCHFSGVSLIENIMARSEVALALLINCGLNLDIKQISGNKSISGFIQGLKDNVARKNLISPLDMKYLFGLEDTLLSQPSSRLQTFGLFQEAAAEANHAEAAPKAAV